MKIVQVLLVSLLLAGCSPMDLLKKGPTITSNAQIGKENTQVLGVNHIYAEPTLKSNASIADLSQGQTNKVKAENVVINETPWQMIVALIIGFILPSPNEIGRSILGLFRRKENGKGL
jgi:hypothetical protein